MSNRNNLKNKQRIGNNKSPSYRDPRCRGGVNGRYSTDWTGRDHLFAMGMS